MKVSAVPGGEDATGRLRAAGIGPIGPVRASTARAVALFTLDILA
jgi:hypothetical protein